MNEERIVNLTILVGMGKNDEELIKKGYAKKEIEEAKKRHHGAERLLWDMKEKRA
jgi:hypothetical protein